ncbi:MAG: hypothetical protein WBE98_18545 [Gammaproteobacteria bacterium]
MAATLPRTDVRSLLSRANLLLPGLYAWVATVAHPAVMRGVPVSARVTALLALVALAGGPVLARGRPALARAAGIYAFSGFSLLTWVLAGDALSPERLDPVRAALGALGWMLHAFGWGATRPLMTVPEDDPNVIAGPPLAARGRLPRGTSAVFGIGVAGAILFVLLAWRVDRPEHALLAHAAAVAAGILVVRAAAEIALERGHKILPPPPQVRINAAVLPLAGLTLALGLGFIWMLLR